MADDAPATPALDAWYANHNYDIRDRVSVSLWYPNEAPTAHLLTRDLGCQSAPVLPDPDRPHVDVRLGSIAVGGLLDDMEAYFDAVRDAVRVARWQADQIARGMAAEAEALAAEADDEGAG